MTILDQVRGLIWRLSPEPICDDCICERRGLSARQHANHKTRELAGMRGVERRKDACLIYGVEKTVISFRAKGPIEYRGRWALALRGLVLPLAPTRGESRRSCP